ncbi:response regulator [Phormidium pseudopriestleyi FRX01]|uniref:Response regulator n=1 Tax=Phormidium pseudopriestleyi FRX01 TaxID=1759528 RepID=A0ABS3FQN4_9CYAN|nr:response regulator [Phormidium pseudopriestleyi]MBO0348926.1 response regulator [Phormidium pseudopriestleyi FRX01]
MSENNSSVATILAVDDSIVMQDLVKRALAQDYRVLVADNAVDALSMIYHEQVSILLLDVSMPGIDGLELCRTVRNIPQFQELPIVMLTARDGLFDKVQGRLAGATEYLTKPFDAAQLRQVVGNFINSNQPSEVAD